MVVDELNGAFGQSGRHLIDRRIVLYHVIIVIEWQCWIGMVGRWMIGPTYRWSREDRKTR